MRRTAQLFGLTLNVWLASAAAAQNAQETYTASVLQPDAVARCGPSDKFYPTNHFRTGEKVTVLGTDPTKQYLRIVPPPRSFSWIDTRHVRQLFPNMPNNYTVSEPGIEVPVYTGSDFEEQSKRHPNHESCKIKYGTQVRAIGAAHTDEAATWLPIEPPSAEVRYMLASSVQRDAETVAAARPSVPPADPVVRPIPAAKPAVVSATSTSASALAPLQSPQQTLFEQAQAYERQRTVFHQIEAEKLYDQVAREADATDPNLAARARAAAYQIHQQRAAYSGARNVCPPPTSACDPAYTPTGRVYPTPVDAAGPPPNVRLNPPAATAPAPVYQPVSTSSISPTRQPENSGVYSERGYLKKAGRAVEGRQAYRLESQNGYPLYYVTAQAGVNLESYLNQYVEVFGPAKYDGGLRANYMSVTRVQPLQ